MTETLTPAPEDFVKEQAAADKMLASAMNAEMQSLDKQGFTWAKDPEIVAKMPRVRNAQNRVDATLWRSQQHQAEWVDQARAEMEDARIAYKPGPGQNLDQPHQPDQNS